MSKVKFGTSEFFKIYQEAINKDEIFSSSGYTSTWAYIITDIKSEVGLPKTFIITWKNGKIVDIREGTPDEDVEYKFEADYDTWAKILSGKLDGKKAMVMGKYKIKGPIVKLMRYAKVLGHLVDVTKNLDVEY